jgi:chemotaxis protein methyltransferase CheR
VRLEIVATDADARLIERARRACFRQSSLKELPHDLLADAFELRDGLYCIAPELRGAIAFRCQDLREAQPGGLFDLVLCRNLAFTYFEAGLRDAVLARILEHLRAGGALAIGLHESLPAAPGLVPWPRARCVYERRDGAPRA